MLLIRTRLGQSALHGIGLFAVEDIREGTEVWRFTPGFDLDLDPGLVNAQQPFLRERLLHYGYLDALLNRYILCCDDARFINHSNTPNLRGCCRGYFFLDRYGVDIAVRDIAAGEEITLNYAALERLRPFQRRDAAAKVRAMDFGTRPAQTNLPTNA
jgi:SET domain-containing protein